MSIHSWEVLGLTLGSPLSSEFGLLMSWLLLAFRLVPEAELFPIHSRSDHSRGHVRTVRTEISISDMHIAAQRLRR